MTIQDLQRLVRQSAVEPIDEQFGKAQYAIQGRAQLVAHIGEKLALVFIGDGKLASLLLDLAKQPRIVHREHRLIGKGPHQADRARGKISGRRRCSTKAPRISFCPSSGTTSTEWKPAESVRSLSG